RFCPRHVRSHGFSLTHPASPATYTLSLHDALPIYALRDGPGSGSLGEPLVIAPVIVAGGDHGPRGGRHLGQPGHRIGLVAPGAVGPQDPELVDLPLTDPGHEDLPDPGGPEGAQGVTAALPAVERTHHLYGAGVGGPDREGGAVDPVDGADLRAQGPPQLLVAAFPDQMQVQLAQSGQEAV